MLELRKEIFLIPEYSDFGSKFYKFGKLIYNYFHVVLLFKIPFLTNVNQKCQTFVFVPVIPYGITDSLPSC